MATYIYVSVRAIVAYLFLMRFACAKRCILCCSAIREYERDVLDSFCFDHNMHGRSVFRAILYRIECVSENC